VLPRVLPYPLTRTNFKNRLSLSLVWGLSRWKARRADLYRRPALWVEGGSARHPIDQREHITL
jgi:hypothetical protein